MTRAAYLIDGCRTPIGKVGGALAHIRPDDLATMALKGLLDRNPRVDPATLDDVFWGATNQAGEDNRNVARMAVLLAGLPETIPGATVNRLCGSGLQAAVSAAHAVMSGDLDLCIAGGSESMTRAPFVLPRADSPFPRSAEIFDSRLGWRMVNPRMQEAFPPISLGETAEEVAARYGVSRERQDELALRSHQRAAAAWDEGRFEGEVVAMNDLSRDETVRADTSAEALAKLRPVFRTGGTVTAGNSSPMNDGAAAVLVGSDDAVASLGAEPLARVVSSASAGVHPDVMGIGPVPATHKALAKAGWSVDDVDLVEINEAFAAQAVAVIDELKLDPERVNVNGGAIAIGHPLGASGARILTTLVHEMKRRGARKGLATMCIGVGQGIAMTVESC